MEFLMDGLLGPFAYYSTVVVFGMLVVAPLKLIGGTASLVNPIAIF